MVVGWCQTIVLCQYWWTSIQGIPAHFGDGGPSAKAYLSAKFCLLVVKAYMLLLMEGREGGGPFPEVYLSAKFCLLVVNAYVLLFPGGGGPSAKVYFSAKFYLIVVKARHIWSCSVGGGGLSSTLCSSDTFYLVVYNSSLCNWFLGGSSVKIYLSVSISTSDFMYKCSNIVIHLLLLIHNYIWIAIIWHNHICEHGDKKTNSQLKTHHISVICK